MVEADSVQTTSNNEAEFEAVLEAGPPNDTTKAGMPPTFLGRTHRFVSGVWDYLLTL